MTLPCALDPEAFHAPLGEHVGSPGYTARIARAREACIECPIMLACRQQGREKHATGIWGGETEEERAAAGYPQPNQPPCGTPAGARWHRRRENAPPCAACLAAETEATQARRARAAANRRVDLAA